jgi:DNA-damage-inducible protein D
MFENYNIESVKKQISEFDKMKFVDEDGVEKISGRQLSKALGYTEWRNFQKAVKRANDQMKATGKDESSAIVEVNKSTQVCNGTNPDGTKRYQNRTITDYNLTRKQAINVANNADTSKPGVALVQEWLYDTSEVGERTINIFNKMNDRRYIENRSSLSLANKCYSATCIDHNVESKDLGIAHNECDKSLYHKSTEEIKEEYGKSNRPKADFIGADMCLAEAYAKKMSAYRMNKVNANGLDECVAISKVAHEKVRNDIIENSGYTPEQLITGEDIRKVQRRYDKLTAEQLKAIEKEF